jgi:hypothetical protein
MTSALLPRDDKGNWLITCIPSSWYVYLYDRGPADPLQVYDDGTERLACDSARDRGELGFENTLTCSTVGQCHLERT